jgi:hypothetical protein
MTAAENSSVSSANNRSTCTSTMWDAHWDYHMRHIVYNLVWALKLTCPVEEQLIQALNAANCTTLPSAKAFLEQSDAFHFVPAEIRSRFIKAVTAADLSAGEKILGTPSR